MKHLFTFFILIITTGAVFAQMPKAINYQAVARNISGEAIANQNIKIRLNIINSANSNAILYSETRQVTTNALGLFNVQIGSAGALATTGNFDAINWTNNSTSIEALNVELDINNNNTFVDMGTQGLVTVPYAFSANEAINAINIGGHYIDTNTPTEGQVLKWESGSWVARPAVRVILVSDVLTSTSASNLAFEMIWASEEITVYAGQTVTLHLMGTLGATAASTSTGISPVYKLMPSGNIVSFTPASYNTVASIQARALHTITGALKVVPPGDPKLSGSNYIVPGTYKFGYGVRNLSPNPLNNNENVNGYIMIQ